MTTPSRWHALWALAAVAFAQQGAPRAGYVYPAGGRQGSTFEVTVGGQFLTGTDSAYISGAGVQAKVLEYARPLRPVEANMLREQLKALMEKRQQGALTADDAKKALDIRAKLATFVRRTANPAIAETVTLQVALSQDAAPGQRELRLASPAGMTNPLVFCIGQLPESSKTRSEAVHLPAAQKKQNQRPNNPPSPPLDVTLPAVVNGQIEPGHADRYRFQARRGQRLVIAASARELIPYISDAVPGWFQATLTLRDPVGKEVDYAGHYLFHPDPVLHFEVPADGAYELEIRDSIYRGREDFVYRIALGELPFVTSLFPLGGRAGARTTVELKGWNLAAAKLTENAKGKAPGVEPISVRNGEWISNAVPFALDALPESTEKEPNNEKQTAQRVKLPIIVNGRIGRPGDTDMLRFSGRAGEEIVAEVFARRLDSPLDSALRLTGASGKELAANDDYEDNAAGLLTHQADSRIAFKLPAKGTYYLQIGDTQHKGGPDYAYRLHITRPQPGFDLRVTPSSIGARGGASIPLTVYALRKDGFTGEIALALKDAPPGFLLDGALIPANEDKVRLTLTVPQGRVEGPRRLAVEGRAIIQGREVRRLAAPAEDMMQAFAYHHLVPVKELLARINAPGRFTVRWKSPANGRVKLPIGGTANLELIAPQQLAGRLQLALSQPPDGLSIERVSPVPGGLAILLRATADQLKPGLKGNLIFDAFVAPPANSGAATPQPNRRQPVGALPALPFEAVAGP